MLILKVSSFAYYSATTMMNVVVHLLKYYCLIVISCIKDDLLICLVTDRVKTDNKKMSIFSIKLMIKV